MDSIFSILTLDKSVSKWIDSLYTLTPVEWHDGLYFKREDKFAPLGYGSINGSKLRQCLWLVDTWYNQGIRGVISGSVAGSPQHPMIAGLCKHYNLGCLIATPVVDNSKYLNMAMAEEYGAKFYKTNIGYARALESISYKLAKRLPAHAVLETNITVDERRNPAIRISAFHEVGAHQVKNIPQDVESIIIPSGSCNSVTSILYGLAVNNFPNLKNVVMLGIGNNGSNNLNYVSRRLEIIGSYLGVNIKDEFHFPWLRKPKNPKYKVHHFDINGSGFCQYSDLMPAQISNIEFHPRYEGKCINFMNENPELFDEFLAKKALFWIVGSEPKVSNFHLS